MAVCEKYAIRHSAFLDWDDDDREKAIAWHLAQREACPKCGTRHEEWDERVGGNPHAYVAVKHRCRGCEVRQEVEETVDPKTDGRGVYVVLRPRRPTDKITLRTRRPGR